MSFSDQNRQLMELSQSEFETGTGQALAMIYPATTPLSEIIIIIVIIIIIIMIDISCISDWDFQIDILLLS